MDKDKYHKFDYKPYRTGIKALIERSPERIRLSTNKQERLLVTWTCKHEINPHEPIFEIREKVVKAVVDNHLPKGTYTPCLFGVGDCKETLDLEPFVVTQNDIEREILKRGGL